MEFQNDWVSVRNQEHWCPKGITGAAQKQQVVLWFKVSQRRGLHSLTWLPYRGNERASSSGLKAKPLGFAHEVGCEPAERSRSRLITLSVTDHVCHLGQSCKACPACPLPGPQSLCVQSERAEFYIATFPSNHLGRYSSVSCKSGSS